MKIVAVLGSPRASGNSAFITNRLLEAARKLGAESQSFALNTLTFRGCQACMACKKSSDTCVLKDDLTEVLAAVKIADVLVMASPVYYGDVTAQMKAFFDRTYSYFTPDYLQPDKKRSRLAEGKKLVFVLTQGQPDEKYFADVFPRYNMFLKMYGFGEMHLIRACGVRNPDDASKRQDVLKLADEIAARIMEGGKQSARHNVERAEGCAMTRNEASRRSCSA